MRMTREAVVFAVSGVFFGILVGWIIGSQQQTFRPATGPASAPAAAQAAGGTPPRPLDEARVRSLEALAQSSASDAVVRVQLGNLYFDAERFADAIRWYEDALRINPRDPNVSTDLGVAYYYTSQPDRALQQFDHSLSIDPNHTKTMLNQGIVRAFGKQDLEGASKAWERVIALAPESPEGRAAKQALDSLKSAHPGLTGPGA